MMSPAWLLDGLAVAMVAVAAVSAARLATARLQANRLSAATPTGLRGADIDIAHLLMGVAMAGMLVASLEALSPDVWQAIFGLFTAWFARRLVDDVKTNGLRSLAGGHRGVHLLHCAAMAYMPAVFTTPDGMAWPLGYPAVAPAFAVVLAGSSIWDVLGQLSGRCNSLGVAPAHAVQQPALATVACRIAMGATMAIMLLIMSSPGEPELPAALCGYQGK